MRRIPFAAAALTLFFSQSAFALQWIEYDNRADFFSVNLPGLPKVREIVYSTEYAHKLPGREYSVQNGPSRYSVTVVDYSNLEKLEAERVKTCQSAGGDGDLCNDHSKTDMRGAIVYATWGFLKKNAKVTHYVYTNADRVEGHEIHLVNADGSQTFASIYMHENRLYILDGTVPKGTPPPIIFQQSMGFLDKDGKRIRYDTPYSNGYPVPRRVR